MDLSQPANGTECPTPPALGSNTELSGLTDAIKALAKDVSEHIGHLGARITTLGAPRVEDRDVRTSH